MDVTRAPFGSWTSPISVDTVLAGDIDMSALCTDGTDLLWIESVPAEDGRNTVRRFSNGTLSEVTPYPANVRSRVNEYGGGALDAADGTVVWCDSLDNSIWLATRGAVPRRIVEPDPRFRYGDLHLAPQLPGILAVREELRDGAEPLTTIVAIGWPKRFAHAGAIDVLCQGADFYANPRLSTAGQLAWMEWSHPDMPWDAAAIRVGSITSAGGHFSIRTSEHIAGGTAQGGVAAQHPKWLPDGRLLFMSDEPGYWNLHCWDGQTSSRIHSDTLDFDLPMWNLGNCAYAPLDSDHVFCSFLEEGVGYLAVINLKTGHTARCTSVSGVNSIASAGGIGYAIVTRPAAGAALVQLSAKGTAVPLYSPTKTTPPVQFTAVSRSILFEGALGPVQAWYYPPTNSNFAGPPDQLPPVIVRSHGGPTAFASNAYKAAIQYWTSRGIAYLDVNYSGSAGFGRRYRNRLRDRWGTADVDDCVAAVDAVVAAGLADPDRVVITGSSAGGYTTLQALVTTDKFSAGVSYYGVADLELLAQDTHKFESHYLDRLIGAYPEQRSRYLERSPIHNLAALRTPLLLLQGAADPIVPPEQAISMASAVREAGLPVALVLFDGEQHGFRKLSSRRSALEAELSFYAQIFGFTPADAIGTLPIDNYPPAAASSAQGRAIPAPPPDEVTDQLSIAGLHPAAPPLPAKRAARGMPDAEVDFKVPDATPSRAADDPATLVFPPIETTATDD